MESLLQLEREAHSEEIELKNRELTFLQMQCDFYKTQEVSSARDREGNTGPPTATVLSDF